MAEVPDIASADFDFPEEHLAAKFLSGNMNLGIFLSVLARSGFRIGNALEGLFEAQLDTPYDPATEVQFWREIGEQAATFHGLLVCHQRMEKLKCLAFSSDGGPT